ncbi:uncharacterized protein LOC143635773 [Bidens hawaiensis]|uniref:uncharacterized protein LOC143635773 n=1 Tax=Bidens hawaiensis TaxID=980011 RepID=UPI00404B4544
MSSDSFSTPDCYPDLEVISNLDSKDDAIFSVIQEAAQLLVKHFESSQPRTRRPHLQRDRVGAHDWLCRFWMSRQLFLRIVGDLERGYTFFQQREDVRGKPGFSPMQKCTAAISQLAYETTSDAMEEYLQMSETVGREALHTFCKCIPQLDGKKN